jgi:para-nitrobenzyl esterase
MAKLLAFKGNVFGQPGIESFIKIRKRGTMNWKDILQFKCVGVILAQALIVAIPADYAYAAAAQVIVQTENGTVAGLQTETMNEFLGIPYAAPPIGTLRWQPPQPPANWSVTLEATQFANHCPQVANPFGTASTTEDCLYLNVYTPPTSKGRKSITLKNLPVMVWVYGGSFVYGQSDWYDPSMLVPENVIVVTINYRLGVLGYLAHPALTAESPSSASGNYGFMDQQAAFAWVKKNIKNFGGNPDNVTIFGESAGGESMHVQLVSPLAAGLFDRVIVESGAYELNPPTLAMEEELGTALAADVGCSGLATNALTVACLQEVPVSTLLTDPNAGAIAMPNVDGYVLLQSIGAALQSGGFNQVPVMEGSNHNEYNLFVAAFFEIPNFLETTPPVTTGVLTNYNAYVDFSLSLSFLANFWPVTNAELAAIVNQYPPGTTEQTADIALGAAGTDGIFACNSRLSIQSLAQYVPTFAYEFNDESAPEVFLPLPYPTFSYGAAHASELQYIWILPQSAQNPLSKAQQKLSSNMVKYWTQFARSGNPNGSSLPNWPKYAHGTDEFQSLAPPLPKTEKGFAASHKCGFWAEYE